MTTSAPSPLRILVVASDPTVLLATATTLREDGHEVVPAEDGMAGLRIASSLPHVIIVDEQLTDLAGRDVCRRLKTIPATALIPVLQLAAPGSSSEANASGLDAAADGRLEHPIDADQLRAAVAALAGHQRLSQVEELAGDLDAAAKAGGGLG